MYQVSRNSYLNRYSAHHYPAPQYTMQPQIYPEDIQCVLPSSDPKKGAIYVSNVQAAQNPKTLEKYGIKAVMTCAKGYHKNIPRSRLQFFEYFPCQDKDQCPISVHFQDAVNFIVKALDKTNILVHCIAGVSRSVSMVLAYLIREKGMTYQEAYHTVKKRRKIICPNDGFIRQLKQYARKQRAADIKTVNKQYPTRKDRQFSQNLPKSAEPVRKYREYQPNQTSNNQQQNEHKNKYDQNEPQICKMTSLMDIPVQKSKYEFTTPIKSHTFLETTPSQQNDSFFRKYRADSTNLKRYQSPPKFGYEQGTKKQYFQEMNRELNDKINAIHQKYEKERQKLYSRRGFSNKNKYQTPLQNSTNKPSYRYEPKYKQNLSTSKINTAKTHYDKQLGDRYSKYENIGYGNSLGQYNKTLYATDKRFKYADYMEDRYNLGINGLRSAGKGYRGYLN